MQNIWPAFLSVLLSDAKPGRLVRGRSHLGYNNLPLPIIVATGTEVLAVVELMLEGAHCGAAVRLIVAHVSHAFFTSAFARCAHARAAEELGWQNGATSIVQPTAEFVVKRTQSGQNQARRSSRAHLTAGCLLLHGSFQRVEVGGSISTAYTHISVNKLLLFLLKNC